MALVTDIAQLFALLDSRQPADWLDFTEGPYASQQARLLFDLIHEARINYGKGGRAYAFQPAPSGAFTALLAAGHIIADVFAGKSVVTFSEAFLEQAALRVPVA